MIGADEGGAVVAAAADKQTVDRTSEIKVGNITTTLIEDGRGSTR